VLHELEVTSSDSTYPLPADFGPNPTPEHEVSQPPIVISPPDVEMTNSTATILFLPSSMRSFPCNSLYVSYCDYTEPSSMNNPISMLIYIPSTSHVSPNLDDAYVNLISHEDALGSSSSSRGLSSSSPPILHSI